MSLRSFTGKRDADAGRREELSRGGLPRVSGFVRVVRAAHQRTRLDVNETKVECNPLELAEFVGMIVARHRRVFGRRTQVLADRQDLAAGMAQILERRDQLVVLL